MLMGKLSNYLWHHGPRKLNFVSRLEVSDFEALDRELDPESFPTNAKLYYLYRLLITIIVQKIPALSGRQSQKSKLNLYP